MSGDIFDRRHSVATTRNNCSCRHRRWHRRYPIEVSHPRWYNGHHRKHFRNEVLVPLWHRLVGSAVRLSLSKGLIRPPGIARTVFCQAVFLLFLPTVPWKNDRSHPIINRWQSICRGFGAERLEGTPGNNRSPTNAAHHLHWFKAFPPSQPLPSYPFHSPATSR